MIGMLASIRNPQNFERIVMLGPSPRYVNDLPIIMEASIRVTSMNCLI